LTHKDATRKQSEPQLNKATKNKQFTKPQKTLHTSQSLLGLVFVAVSLHQQSVILHCPLKLT